jgi:golgin subfamily B member 1
LLFFGVTMSAQKIRAALGQLQDDPNGEPAWTELADELTAPDPGIGRDELRTLMEAARRGHETRREWDAVARLLEFEIALHAGTPVEFAMQFELARILEDEILDDRKATEAYARLLELRPEDPTAREAIERGEAKRKKWKELVARYIEEAGQTTDEAFKSSLLMSASEVAYRYGDRTKKALAEISGRLEEALRIDPKNLRVAVLLERIYRGQEAWEKAATVIETIATEAPGRDERAAALIRLGRIFKARMNASDRAASAYERLLDLWPGNTEAMSFLSEHFSKSEQWDHLVALYEDQLRSGSAKASDESGIVFQIAMVNWKMRKRVDLAEPYFDRLRRLEPAHSGMLGFFREFCAENNDPARLLTILTDAQRALGDSREKTALASEIAKIAEAGSNAQKAIDQYKTILRQDPTNHDARQALKRLYAQTEGWNALIELLRQDLERAPADDTAGRLSVLKEIAQVYRDRIKSDTALVTVLSQIVQLDDNDIESLRELVRVYEALGRWRDLLQHQSRLAMLLPHGTDKADLLRSIARRWLDQFSNAQNATSTYEALIETVPGDPEALEKLKELYTKRRAWGPLYDLFAKQAEAATGQRRLDVLAEMAKLAAERLDRGADAIRIYKTILEQDPTRVDVLDLLEKQADRDKDFATVAWVLERRLAAADQDAARLVVLQKLGGVYADRLGDHDGAARTWRRVLEIQPGHPKALRVLRDSYLAGDDYDAIEQLYGSQNDWEGLAEVLSTAADKATNPDTKVDLSFRTARVLTEKLGAPGRAFRSYERVLAVQPDDARAVRALTEIYEAEEKWARLVPLYESLLAKSTDDDEKLDLYKRLADVTGHRLGDRNAALSWARKAYDLRSDDDRLEQLEDASRAAKSWDLYVDALGSKLKKKKGVSGKERRALRNKLAKLHSELGQIDEAIAAYRALVEEDPEDADSVAGFDALLRDQNRRDDLRWLFDLRATKGKADERVGVLTEWATLEQDAFGEPERAVALYGRALELDPANVEAARVLPRLLLAAGKPDEAATVIAAHLPHRETNERAEGELDLADIYRDSLARPAEAFECAARALDTVPHLPRAVAMLDRLLGVPETRAKVAALLEAEYAELGDPRKQAQALAVLLETTTDPALRLPLYVKLATLEETRLSSAGRAFDLILRAVAEFPDRIDLWDRTADLAVRAARPTDLAEAYRTVLVTGSAVPKDLEIELCNRAAALHDEKLGDPEAATPYLEKVIEHNPGDEKAFSRLKQILTSHEKWGELEALYEKAVSGTTDGQRRTDLLNEVALVCEEITNEPAKAIAYYEKILDLDSRHDNAVRALEQLYAREGQYAKLASLLERRLEASTQAETIQLKVRLGQIDLDQLHDPERALGHLEEVLRLDVGNSDARKLVERILEIGSLRTRAADVLEAVYDARDEVRDLVRVLEIRLEGAENDTDRRELLRRIAVLRDERLRDDAGAFETLARLVPLDPTDAAARERMTEIGRRLSAHDRLADVLAQTAAATDNPALRSEISMQVGQIYESLLGDHGKAEAIYRLALGIDPKDPALALPPARALERLYEVSGNHVALADILQIEVALEENVDLRRDLLARLGDLCEAVLDDPRRAIEAWRHRIEDEPSDDRALAALERLYARTESYRDLVDTLKAREQNATSAQARRELMTKIAHTLGDKLGDNAEAILAFRAVVDEFGPERSLLSALESLYAAAGRHSDLAETLEMDLGLSEEPRARVEVFAHLGDVRRLHQSDWPGALDAYRQALSLDPSHAASRAGIEQLLDVPDARRDAAETLHPLYEADGDHQRLLRVLEIEAETADSIGQKLQVLETASRVAEQQQHDLGRAFDYAVRGVRESAAEPEIKQWIERAERLAAATNRHAELVELLRKALPDVLDGDVQLDVSLRIAELARTKTNDMTLARTYYQKALDLRGDDRRALLALESLYGEMNDGPALLDILRRRVDAAANDGEKKQLLFRQAKLNAEVIGDNDAAIAVYESILDIALEPEAVSQLEVLYRDKGRWRDLVSLYERQIDQPGANQAPLRVKIAVIARQQLEDVERAFEELGAALEVDAQNEPAIAELEALLSDGPSPEHRGRAAEMLEPVYLRRADFPRLMAAMEARLQSSQDPDERRSLLRRLATLREEQTEDYPGALETVAKLLHEDISDESTWAELERLAKVAAAQSRLAEVYATELEAVTSDDEQTAKLSRRTGELFAGLGNTERALHFFRRAHHFEPESRDLFDAIDALLVKDNRAVERVELYRNALEYRFDPPDRVALLHTIADLERRALNEPDRAIETYRSALEVDDADATALNALGELYRGRGRFKDLADLLERRADQDAGNTAVACGYRLALARLQRTELENVEGAIDQYERIVEIAPDNADAIADLDGLLSVPEHKERVVEILRPIYERADDWRHLIALNGQRFELARSRSDKLAVLAETAELWEKRGKDDWHALAALRAAFELDPDDETTRTELERVAGKLEAWDDLAASYEHGIDAADPLVKRQLLEKMATLHDQKRDDPRKALEAYERLAALDETEQAPLDAMDQLATLLSDWQVLVRVLTKKVDLVSDDSERASLLRRIGETKRDMLDDPRGAIVAYEHALELDPESTFTIDSLIDLFERTDDHRRLVELYRRRVELAGDDDADLKYNLLLLSADCFEKKLSQPRDAIEALRDALAVRPSDKPVLQSLDRLYRAEQMWSELLDNLRMQAANATDAGDRVRLKGEIGDLHAKRLDDLNAALDAYREVLDEQPANAAAIEAVTEIGTSREDLSLTAADILEPVLRNASQFDRLVQVLDMRAHAQTDPTERAQTLRSIARVLDLSLSKPAEAQDVLTRALAETPEDEQLYTEIERLAAASGGFSRYADALEERASSIFDAVVAQEIWKRLGRIAEQQLEDDRRAIAAYVKAGEQAGEQPDILAALDRLYLRVGDAKALSEILERRTVVEPDAKQQAELFYRLAKLQVSESGKKQLGLATLKQALERDADHAGARETLEELTGEKDLFEEAAEALEAVYRAKGDNARLTSLFEKRIAFVDAPTDRTRMRLDLVRHLEDQLKDTRRAQQVLEDALADDPAEADVIAELERLAPINSGWASAAAKLSAAITSSRDLAPDAARDAYVRLAGWYERKLNNPAEGEASLEHALEKDPENVEILRAIEKMRRMPGRERDLVTTLRRLAELQTDMNSKRDLYREAKAVAEGSVRDPALAEDVLRQLLKEDDANLWALEELTRLREAASDHAEVLSLVLKRAGLSEGDDIARLEHQAAEIAHTKLNDPDRAIQLYEKIFEDSPTDDRAASALRNLFTAAKRTKDLAKLLGRLIDVAPGPEQRTTLRLELAKLQSASSKKGAKEDAIDTLRSILEEDPANHDTVLALSQLYETTGRDEDLAVLLDSQIALAKGRNDTGAELSLTVRLGEIYESRLGNTVKAIETYEAVLDREPQHKQALEALGRLFESKGELAKAGAALEKLLSVSEGTDAVALVIRLADIFLQLKDDTGAERVLERGVAIEQTNTEIRKRLAQAYERMQNWGGLARLVSGDAEAATDTDTKVQLYRTAARLFLEKQKDAVQSAALLERATALAPTDRDLLLALCDSYSAAGRSKDAAAALEKVVASFAGKRSKELAAIHQRLSRAYLADGDKARALAELDHAFKIDPGSVPILRDLGTLSLDVGDLDRAQKTFRGLLLQRLEPGAPITKAEVFYYLGEISHRQGDKPKAVQMLERAIENDVNLTKAKDLLAELKK